MGTRMMSGTLEQGFVGFKPSQTEKPCKKIPEEKDSVFVRNHSNKCSTNDVNNTRPDVNVNVNDVKLAWIFGKRSTRESTVSDGVDGHNELNKGCGSVNFTDHKTSVLGIFDERINKDVPNVGFEVDKFEGCVIKSDDVSLCPEPSSPTDIEFSGEDISLFVEVFGPLDVKEEVKKDGLLEKNGKNTDKNLIFKNERENFDVGDLVWAKTQTPLWWPGIISDPSSNEAKSGKRSAFLVKYFGHANPIWCSNSDLKPFIEYYEQLSRQNTSRSFRGSVEKALSVFGQRVKSKMTCPCFSKENTFTLADTKGKKIDDDFLSLSCFDPVSFLKCVRKFASSCCSPGKIELTVVKNRLSSFYLSSGHSELLTDEVKVEGCNYNYGGREKSSRVRKKRIPSDYDDLASADKVLSSSSSKYHRERKKSKFLSSPFVKVHHVVSIADDINAPSSELLAELRSTVCDPLYLKGSKYSDSFEKFYCSFRSYAFLNADIIADKEEARVNQETKREKTRKETKGQKKKGTKSVKKKEESDNSRLNLDSISKLPNIAESFLGQVGPKAGVNKVTCQQPLQQPAEIEKISPQMELGNGKGIINKMSDFFDWVPQTEPPEIIVNDSSTSDGTHQQQKRARKEDPGGSLVLKFALGGSDLPSVETLVRKFSRYGLVKVTEIRALNSTTVEIPYERTSDLCFAHRSLESDRPFGPDLVGFDLNCPHVKVEKNSQKSPVLTIGPLHRPAPLDIGFMKQNVEMMKATLEKMGDKIPRDAKAKLENEIRAFLGKIGNITGGSSSS
ncbi:Tudor/PWWP/MBT superfamily protein [Striga asiatica]|uniref:Tudor/PWWP/MBT superfamily protein n=1 Tax=Striga asiatica TaxID=4170 RepID=A0A5A7RHZ7_STRAF|nr:Tudor/PWWP/MBT superfamily protein [Striga asiatica]